MSLYVALLALIDYNIVEAKVSAPIQLNLTITLYYISKVSTRDLCLLSLAASCLTSTGFLTRKQTLPLISAVNSRW
jgi:hypothetical protein